MTYHLLKNPAVSLVWSKYVLQCWFHLIVVERVYNGESRQQFAEESTTGSHTSFHSPLAGMYGLCSHIGQWRIACQATRPGGVLKRRGNRERRTGYNVILKTSGENVSGTRSNIVRGFSTPQIRTQSDRSAFLHWAVLTMIPDDDTISSQKGYHGSEIADW